jgi:hypothetical protein
MSVTNRFAVGLGLIDAIAGLDAKSVKLQSRVGFVTGLVVVGDLIGEGSAREQSIVGETPDLAVSLRSCLPRCAMRSAPKVRFARHAAGSPPPRSLDPVNKEPQWPVGFADFGSLIAGNHRRSRRCRRCLLPCHFGMCRNRRNSNCCWGARSVRIHVPRHRAVGLGVRIRLPSAESPCPASCTSQNSLNGDPLRACWLDVIIVRGDKIAALGQHGPTPHFPRHARFRRVERHQFTL